MSSSGATFCQPCDPTTEVLNMRKSACVCVSGYGAVDNRCMPCADGYVHAENKSEEGRVACTQCSGDQSVSNLGHKKCITKAECDKLNHA